LPVLVRRVIPESLVAAFVFAAVAVMAGGYLLDLVRLPMPPVVLGVAALCAGVWAFLAFREPDAASRGSVALFAVVVACALAYLLWLASPALLPITDGPDVVHHLQLIHLIQRTHRLPHDPALQAYLVEMMNYTPGGHIVAATVAGWLRVDALRVLFPVTAIFVAVKFGLVYALAVRVIGERPGAAVQAASAPVLLLVPAAYTLGSFFQFYFYAQVVSETFVMAMVLGALGWTRTSDRRYLWLMAACGAGSVLSWPVWIVPAGAVAVAAIAGTRQSWSARIAAIATALLPAVALAIVHAWTHAAGAATIGSAGVVTKASAASLGVAFVALGMVGAILAVRHAAARPLAVLLSVALLESLAIAALEIRGLTPASRTLAGAPPSFYLPFKMVYLMVPPLAVLGAIALARVANGLASFLPVVRGPALAIPVIVAAILANGRFPLKRQHGPITESALAAGLWTRSQPVPAACVDYFSRHWLTGYWLHLDVLGNPRLSDRMRVETFEFADTAGRWLEGRGQPYAIVEDLSAIPHDIRVDMAVLHEFPPSALVQNTRPRPPARPHERSGSDPDFPLCAGK
jgi:hypothetical protein